MTSRDVTTMKLADAEATNEAGRSLVSTLYSGPLTIALTGDIGAGKTTFFRGFAEALGITENVTSPTYALEQRYPTSKHGEVLHLDLYRLTPEQAQDLVRQSESHTGIRCIEWADRLGNIPEHAMHIHIAEEQQGRTLTCTFADNPLPDEADVEQWRIDAGLPENVIAHCNVVAETAASLADELMQKRHWIIRREAVRMGGLLHDLFRFLDFRTGGFHGAPPVTPERQAVWDRVRAEFPGMRHEAAVAAFLKSKGYEQLAEIIKTHGVHVPPGTESTIEQKVLYYADKLVALDKRVTLEERFRDFSERYAGGKQTDENMHWFEQAKNVEKELGLS